MTDTTITPVSTARLFNLTVLPAVEDGQVPFWRVVLRGCSQCCFQTNEVTGVIFLVAVLTYSWQQSLLMLMGAVIGAVRRTASAQRAGPARTRTVRIQLLPDGPRSRQLLRARRSAVACCGSAVHSVVGRGMGNAEVVPVSHARSTVHRRLLDLLATGRQPRSDEAAVPAVHRRGRVPHQGRLCRHGCRTVRRHRSCRSAVLRRCR